MQRIHLVVPSFAPTARTDNRQFATVYGEGLRVGDEVTSPCGDRCAYRGEIYEVKSGTTAVGYAYLRYVGGEDSEQSPQGGRPSQQTFEGGSTPAYFNEQRADIPVGDGMGDTGPGTTGGDPPTPPPPPQNPPPPPGP